MDSGTPSAHGLFASTPAAQRTRAAGSSPSPQGRNPPSAPCRIGKPSCRVPTNETRPDPTGGLSARTQQPRPLCWLGRICAGHSPGAGHSVPAVRRLRLTPTGSDERQEAVGRPRAPGHPRCSAHSRPTSRANGQLRDTAVAHRSSGGSYRQAATRLYLQENAARPIQQIGVGHVGMAAPLRPACLTNGSRGPISR